MATLAPQGPFRAFTNNGLPLNGGKLFTYEAGTTTPKATFTTSSGAIANANPVILDSAGYANVWLGDGAYKFILQDSLDNTLWTVDNIIGSLQNTFAGVVVTTAANLPITTLNLNNLIICTATLTLSLLAAATAAQGFVISVSNTGTGTVTIDPNAAELINGVSNFTLLPGESAMIVCDGTQWYTVFNSSKLTSLGTTIASAATTSLGAADSDFITVSGTTGITSFGTPTSFGRRHVWVVFSGILTVTHNATSLILPGAANYTTAAGDMFECVHISGANWQVVNIVRATGRAVSVAPPPVLLTFTSSGTYTPTAGMVACIAECVGGGGAGSDFSGGLNGGGGGAGGYSKVRLSAAQVGVSQVVTIGAGGGTTGGTTSLGSLLVATGGTRDGTSAGGVGGGAGGGTGDIKAQGSPGTNGGTGTFAGGIGGSTIFGGGGCVGSPNADPNSGAGGAGGRTGATTGGTGGSGRIVITEFF